jgi:DNA-binding XRE family transcriptional regulator
MAEYKDDYKAYEGYTGQEKLKRWRFDFDLYIKRRKPPIDRYEVAALVHLIYSWAKANKIHVDARRLYYGMYGPAREEDIPEPPKRKKPRKRAPVQKRLQLAMVAANITTRQLAKKIDVSHQLIYHWLRRKKKPLPKHCKNISEVLGVTEAWIWDNATTGGIPGL